MPWFSHSWHKLILCQTEENLSLLRSDKTKVPALSEQRCSRQARILPVRAEESRHISLLNRGHLQAHFCPLQQILKDEPSSLAVEVP